MPNIVDVLDKQMGLVIPVNAKRALYLSTSYPSRFQIQNYKQLKKELAEMARLAARHPVEFQEKLTLEDVKDQDLTLVSMEEKEGTSGTYFLMRVKCKDGKTGYINMGFQAICDALRTVDVKKELPAEITFVKKAGGWIMI